MLIAQVLVVHLPFHENELLRYKTFGPIYGHFEGAAPLLSVADPELLRNIMVKDFQFFANRRVSFPHLFEYICKHVIRSWICNGRIDKRNEIKL
ncbi:hypothetical protein TNCT_531281 [Trichonephila clavata]|uniref:Uncharacterized protein n=1 Tax=Trichonephila clavata TaxID=2740835 RepID=A0A8X6K3I8_TRICU|nr:hypothetical protein TNCT_531281 [Trichonephila clavata]